MCKFMCTTIGLTLELSENSLTKIAIYVILHAKHVVCYGFI